jgi:tRNA-splicing ligase RtcB
MMKKINKIFGKKIIDEACITQLENCFDEQDIAVLTADAHKGYGHPIGGAIAYKNHISVSGVGFDIGCGNKAVKTNIKSADLDVSKIMDEIFARISFGTGRVNNEPIDHQVLEQIDGAYFKPQRKMLQLAAAQLGTVGSGNHFIDLFVDIDGWVWIGVHFGSRGFGHKTASGFIAMSQGLAFEDRGKEGSMDSKPILFEAGTALFDDYIEAMSLAGDYAYAGRDVVVNKVLEILGAQSTFEVHNHHNFAWREPHFGKMYWVVRKGCTPAFPGQLGFIGANMMDYSVIVEGIDSADSEQGLYSTVHGAGRIMSRTEAAGKSKWKNGQKIKVSEGKIDFDKVKEQMKIKGVELRGAGADEAPNAYKKLSEVLEYHEGTIEIRHVLKPIGVAMAGNEIFDPYKD